MRRRSWPAEPTRGRNAAIRVRFLRGQAPGASRSDGELLRRQGVRMVHRRQGAVRSVPGVSAPQSAVLHQLGRASFAIQRPGENAGRHEAAASSIDDGCLPKRAEGQLVQIAMHEAARIAQH
jgi:hypothetical protein